MMRPEDMLRATEVKPEESRQPVWLMSFADFTGCLLASFVLLFALSQMDQQKLTSRAAMQGAQISGGETGQTADKSMATRPAEDGKDIDYLATLLQTKLDDDASLAALSLTSEADFVRLDLPARLLTATETAEKERGGALLHVLAGILAVLPNDCIVQTELPPAADAKGDNWGPGLRLAEDIVQRLRDAGAPDSLIGRTTMTADTQAHIGVLILRETEIQ